MQMCRHADTANAAIGNTEDAHVQRKVEQSSNRHERVLNKQQQETNDFKYEVCWSVYNTMINFSIWLQKRYYLAIGQYLCEPQHLNNLCLTCHWNFKHMMLLFSHLFAENSLNTSLMRKSFPMFHFFKVKTWVSRIFQFMPWCFCFTFENIEGIWRGS